MGLGLSRDVLQILHYGDSAHFPRRCHALVVTLFFGRPSPRRPD